MKGNITPRAVSLAGVCFFAVIFCGYTSYRTVEQEQTLMIATELSEKGKWPESITQYKKYLEKNPQGIAAKKDMGMLYAWSNEWKQAQKELDAYLRKVPTDVEALEVLGDAYLYDEQYKKAQETYAKIIRLDPGMETSLRQKTKAVRMARSSYLTYGYNYYKEKNKHLDYRSVSQEHDWSWYQFLRDNLFLIGSFGTRMDDALGKHTPIYGTGFLAKVFRRSWLEVTSKFEKDRTINPAGRVRSVFSTIPRKKYVLSVSEETVWYWDSNISHSLNLNLSRSFLKDDSLLLMVSLYYDHIRKPSSYFVRIEVPNGGESTKPLDLWTQAVTVEKSFKLHSRVDVAAGETVKLNTDDTKTFDTFGRLILKICDRIKVFFYGAWGRDTDRYETVSASAYMSVIF